MSGGIEVDALVKTFGGARAVRAVDGLSFSARPGEVFGLLGPNGAGKTTTLRVVSTLLTPDAGRVTVHGFDTRTHPREVRGAMGFVSPTTGLYGRLTVREMIMYVARLQGVPEPRAATDAILQRLEASSFADARCDALSTGMRQKVSIARALVHEPPVLVLDEPTLGLDVLVARRVREEIIRCRDMGRCVVMSTHVMAEAQRLCDRVAIVHRGRVLAEGEPTTLMQSLGAESLEDAFIALVEKGS